jgi:apolipoprotein N-acyltransferase
VQKITQFIRSHPRWVAFVAGAASATGFAPLNLWPVTLFCFALFMHLVAQAETGKRAAMIGWLFGVGHFTIGNNWIAVAFTFQAAMPAWLGWIAVVALALYLAVYPALCAWGAWWIGRRVNPPRDGEVAADALAADDGGGAQSYATPQTPSTTGLHPLVPVPVSGRIGLPFILAFAGCWIITEWLRSWVFTGFAWNPLAAVLASESFDWWLPTVGTYGASGLVTLAGSALLLLALRQWKTGILFAVIVGVVILGSIKIYVTDPSLHEQPTLTIVQPNISQADKYAPGYDALNFAKLAMDSRPLPDQGARLLLWPEAAIPDYLESGYPYRYYQFQPGESAVGARLRLTTLMGKGDILLTGSNRLIFDKQGQLTAARNSMTAMDAQGRILGDYDKAHLVPYGEYLPLKWLLTPLGLSRLVPGDIDFLPGPGAQTMTLTLDSKPIKIGMQICYEIIFSGQVVDRKNRPDFLFNPSNDAWFGTWGPPQHLAQARLRAIEEGLPVVRATPTGISAVIDADGRIVESLGHGKAGRIDARLPVAKAPTLFARYGNILPVGFALLLIAFALLPLARARTSR